jgi:DNA invertase Pin-like site-specific DNA recombinase
MKIFIGRSSTSGAGRQEMSGDIQLNEVEAKYGPMDRVFMDRGISGSAPIERRPALLDALATLKKGDTLYCYSFSRIARDTFLHLFLEKEASVKGFEIMSVAEEDSCGAGAEKKLFRTLIAAISEYEKSVIRARIIASRRKMRKDGKFLGGKRQYGWSKVGDRVIPVPAEQEVLVEMVGKRKAGTTIKAITDDLNTAGIASATGSSWNYHSVRHILKREVVRA